MFDLSNLISPIRQDIKDLQSGAIKTWSPTDIQIMNQCLLRLYKKKVLKHYGKQSPEGKRGDEFALALGCPAIVAGGAARDGGEAGQLACWHRQPGGLGLGAFRSGHDLSRGSDSG